MKTFRNDKIKTIGWIPDLSIKTLKNISKIKLLRIGKYIINEIKNSDKIFVSSFQVKKEFKKYYKIKQNNPIKNIK